MPSEIDDTSEHDYESELKVRKRQNETELLQVTHEKESMKANTSSNLPPLEMDIERFSSLSKLLRVTALALRFINRLRHRCEFEGVVTRDELDQAEKLWILHVQRKHFSEVYDSIQNRKSHNLHRQLGLYIDCDGILKCKGRIEHAELTDLYFYRNMSSSRN